MSRLIGQLEAVKRGVEERDICECLDTMRQVKAAQNALKKFSEAYVKAYMRDCLKKKMGRQDIEQDLEQIVTSAFSM